jgi:hypothetical protein
MLNDAVQAVRAWCVQAAGRGGQRTQQCSRLSPSWRRLRIAQIVTVRAMFQRKGDRMWRYLVRPDGFFSGPRRTGPLLTWLREQWGKD